MLVVGPRSERIDRLQAARARLGLAPAELIGYRQALARARSGGAWPELRRDPIVRFESADGDPETEWLFLHEGAAVVEPSLRRAVRVRVPPWDEWIADPGRIWSLRQHHLGMGVVLRAIERAAANAAGIPMNGAEDILACFDKRTTHARLASAGIPVPRALAPVACFDEVAASMGDLGLRRVMVKAAHGAGAQGVVALATDGRRWVAYTTVSVQPPSASPQSKTENDAVLYNTRRVRRLEALGDIRHLVDSMCRHVVHAEEWIPKASCPGGAFDLRVVVIHGRAEHVLVRTARGPFTNRHLGGRRGSWSAVRERLGEVGWARCRDACERSLACFPTMRYAGVDLLIAQSWRRHAVLEVNAFGDWVRGVDNDVDNGGDNGGIDTYEAELVAIERDAVQQRSTVHA